MRIVSVLIAAAFAPVLFAQAPTLKPGQYEIVAVTALPNRPPMPPRKDLKCYTAKELESIANIVAGRDTAKGQCHTLSSKVSGSTMTFTIECPNGEDKLTSSGDVNFTSQESYHAVVHMSVAMARSGGPGLNNATITVDAKRIGECTK